MNKLKRVSALVIAGMTLLLASGPGHALGFGRPFSRAILGDTLQVTVPLRLETGEEITDECLGADVYFGEEKVNASAVATTVQTSESGERVLKVSTTALINEPVVTVYLAAGCHARMTRKFVAFADPPGMMMPSVGEVTPANVAVINERAGDDARPRRASTSGRKASSARMASDTASEHKSRRARHGQADQEQVALAADTPVMSGKAARVVAEPQGDVRPSQRGQLRAEQHLGGAASRRAESGRLELDTVPVNAVELPDLVMSSSMGVMLQADDQSPEVMARRRTAAALWVALNATPEQMARDKQRIDDLEQRLTQLTADNQRARQSLAQAQNAGGSSRWLALLGLVAVVAVGAAVYLAVRLKKAGGAKSKDAWWHSQTDARSREPVGDVASDMERTSAFVRTPTSSAGESGKAATAADTPQPKPASPTATPAMAPAPSVFTPPLTKQNLHDVVPDTPRAANVSTSIPVVLSSQAAEPLREVSVEELIDLEQQAEFFVVLGQDDAAISLLEGHVMQTTGASPLPFLKLMEIHRRLGRRDDYERVQTSFNLRFNAHAPSWDADLQQGHALEEYPGVVERLQSLWQTPVKAMEVLEKSLTRPDASADTFELAAYRELLFLYAVARDLSERELHERGNVDLLLPAMGVDTDDDLPTVAHKEAELQDSGEPLMVTRPIKAQPEALPSMSLDFHLDDLPEPSDTAKHH